MHTAILLYVIFVNIIAFVMYGADKHKARCRRWRISETSLLATAVIGGSIGAWCGMRFWHHKTKHLKFNYGIPLIFFIQVIIAIYLITNY